MEPLPPATVENVEDVEDVEREHVASAAERTDPAARHGALVRIVGAIGAWIIYRLVAIFGRRHERAGIEWLNGPIGGERIGDAPYREIAEQENLTVERHATDGGLLPDFSALSSPGFDASRVHPKVRAFYEHTSRYAMDVWSESYFPMNIGMWLLVKTISVQVNQLNFPLSPLDTALGMSSEIISMRDSAGRVRYTGWFRTLMHQKAVVYTGFYMSQQPPAESGPCVKVVFPMPHGNATVILRPGFTADGAFTLDSSGSRFGGAGFYRVHDQRERGVRVWQIKTLREYFRVYVDADGVLRCDHLVRFLGMPVLRLHYKIFERR